MLDIEHNTLLVIVLFVLICINQHMDEERILSAISLEKDVDGFHPLNVGNLALRSRKPLFLPCAAKACIELLLQSGIELMGKHVTVIGRSKVVGLPTSLLLQVKFSQLRHIYYFLRTFYHTRTIYWHYFFPEASCHCQCYPCLHNKSRGDYPRIWHCDISCWSGQSCKRNLVKARCSCDWCGDKSNRGKD